MKRADSGKSRGLPIQCPTSTNPAGLRVEIEKPPHEPERVYFPRLDGARFVAFLLVYLFHGGIEASLLALFVGRTVAEELREKGWVGVELFFILSGYLITTLFAREEIKFGRIDLKAFWIRRILRIWPLYCLIVAIGFLFIPGLRGRWGRPAIANCWRRIWLRSSGSWGTGRCR